MSAVRLKDSKDYITPETVRTYRKIYANIDDSGDEKLQVSELIDAFRYVGLHLSEKDVMKEFGLKKAKDEIDFDRFKRWLHFRKFTKQTDDCAISDKHVKMFVDTMPSYGALEKVGKRTEQATPPKIVSIGRVHMPIYTHKHASQLVVHSATSLVHNTQQLAVKLDSERKKVDSELRDATKALDEFTKTQVAGFSLNCICFTCDCCFLCHPSVIVPFFVVLMMFAIVAYLGNTVGIAGPKTFMALCIAMFTAAVAAAITDWRFGSNLDRLQKMAAIFREHNKQLRRSIKELREKRQNLTNEISYVGEELREMQKLVKEFDTLREELEKMYKDRKSVDIENLFSEMEQLQASTSRVMREHYLSMFYDVLLSDPHNNNRMQMNDKNYQRFRDRLTHDEQKVFKSRIHKRVNADQFVELVEKALSKPL